jgi:hypothetical protein
MCAGKASFYDPDPKLRLVTVAKLLFDPSKLVLDGFGIHGSTHQPTPTGTEALSVTRPAEGFYP